MDPELSALASRAASAVVRTSTWERTAAAVGGLWRRADPALADGVVADLAGTRAEVLAATDPDVERDLVVEWRNRLRRLLAAHPELVEEVRRIAEEHAPDRPPHSAVTMTATASDSARIYQAGRDQDIHGGDR